MHAKTKGVLLVGAMGVFAALAQAQDPSVDLLSAALSSAASQHDSDSLLKQATRASREALQQAEEADRALESSMVQFVSALDARYGASPELVRSAHESPLVSLQRVRRVVVLAHEPGASGTVVLHLKVDVADQSDAGTVTTLDQWVPALREDGAWKLDLTPLLDRRASERTTMQVVRTTQRLNGGEFATRLSAMIALDRALRSAAVAP